MGHARAGKANKQGTRTHADVDQGAIARWLRHALRQLPVNPQKPIVRAAVTPTRKRYGRPLVGTHHVPKTKRRAA